MSHSHSTYAIVSFLAIYFFYLGMFIWLLSCAIIDKSPTIYNSVMLSTLMTGMLACHPEINHHLGWNLPKVGWMLGCFGGPIGPIFYGTSGYLILGIAFFPWLLKIKRLNKTGRMR